DHHCTVRQRAHEAVRRSHRRRRPRHRGAVRRRRRLRRPERRRQDHDHGDAARPRAAHLGDRDRARSFDRRAGGVPLGGRRPDREPGLLPVPLGRREPAPAGDGGRARSDADPLAARPGRPPRPRRRPVPELLARDEATARHRCGAAGGSRPARPRRAGERPRPPGSAGDAGPHRRPAGQRAHGARVLARPQRARAGVRLARADRHRSLALPGPDQRPARRRRPPAGDRRQPPRRPPVAAGGAGPPRARRAARRGSPRRAHRRLRGRQRAGGRSEPGRLRRRDRPRRAQPAAVVARGPLPHDGAGGCPM
ncbi:MAG: Efflux ABC transporter, ATP-binding protein, partial [uncultured Acidimicrobiales bacterium]